MRHWPGASGNGRVFINGALEKGQAPAGLAGASGKHMSRVVEILISSASSAAMEARDDIRAFPGRGLEGDRYCLGNGTFSPQPQKPDYEVTLIEQEKIEAFCRESGLPFTSSHARRNIVTQGVDLNSLVGKTFRIGEVLIHGIRLCEPCNYLAKTSFPEALSGLVHKAGLRAQIMSEGIIHVGDAIVKQ